MDFPQRKKPRLQGFDYAAANYYYITLCTKGKAPIFGKTGELSVFGHIAKEELEKIPSFYRDVVVDLYVIMPNHIHVVLAIGCDSEQQDNPTLSSVVALYKAGVSRRIHQLNPPVQVWQKSFYDEIIRNESHYKSVWNYIVGNPLK